MKWFEKSYRRHLLDMHINDWEDGRFLSKFSAEEYYKNLKKANVKSAMIYLQSHVGYCYYPTKVGHVHGAFKDRPYEMKKLIELCRNGGIDVVAYYSLNYNTLEANCHPEWSVVHDFNGGLSNFTGNRYLICCPNKPDYRNFVLTQVQEIIEYAEFDGLFFDMPFWNDICYCEECKRRFREEYGLEMPLSCEESSWETLLEAREKWNGEYLRDINKRVKEINEGISIEYNYAHAVLDALTIMGTEIVNEYQDYASGDLYNGFLTQSFACKFYYAVSKNQPFEYMTGRCDPDLQMHTLTKSPDKLRLAAYITTAHHGANFVIDAIDPIGTMDSRFYDELGEIYRETEKYEPYLRKGELFTDVGLMYIMEGRSREKNINKNCHYNATIGAASTLIREHIPYGIFTQNTIDEIQKYKVVVLSNPNHLNNDSIKKIIEYVKNGGILYFSGKDEPVLLKELLDAEADRERTGCGITYYAPKKEMEGTFANFNVKYPLPFDYSLPVLSEYDGEILATVSMPYFPPNSKYSFSSIHSNPPGTYTDIPAVILRKLGKGTVVWSGAQLEMEKQYKYSQIFVNLLKYAGYTMPSIISTASNKTEVVCFKDDNTILVSAYYMTDEDKTELQVPFSISVKCEKPKCVILVRTGEQIDFTYENGYTVFKTEPLKIFDMYKIDI